jgi:ubiquinone/menaquinone biosynthesis C-methylase UbiE
VGRKPLVGAVGVDQARAMTTQADLDDRIRRYYGSRYVEAERLTTRSAAGQVEAARIRALVEARIAPASRVLDVGGGTGAHAAWLAAAGHDVTLIDPVPEHVAAASAVGTFGAQEGDARALAFPDASADVVLLLGPLYHLRDRADRLQALAEAHRVLRPGGQVLAAGISRSIAALDLVLAADFTDLPGAALIRLLETGESLDDADGFPAGHFHTAAELRSELEDAGFREVTVTGIEGPGSLALELVRPDAQVVAAATVLAERAQGHPGSADLSGHLLAAGVR